MKQIGHLQKMKVEYGNPLEYSLILDNEPYPINVYIGQRITIEFLGEIHCNACKKSILKSYNQGYCYQCFKVLAANDRCMMAPEHCHYDKGTCREPNWGMSFCMKPHVVYLAWTSGYKVGLSRLSQYQTRWMDQGATHAVAICQVETRKDAGIMEDYLRTWYRDRTQWKSMIQMPIQDIDILKEAEKLTTHLQKFEPVLMPKKVHHFHYPVEAIGALETLSLDKQKSISGYLLGIKGQYLILDTGVINIRKHGSYLVKVTID
jgi:hypothetical protein